MVSYLAWATDDGTLGRSRPRGAQRILRANRTRVSRCLLDSRTTPQPLPEPASCQPRETGDPKRNQSHRRKLTHPAAHTPYRNLLRLTILNFLAKVERRIVYKPLGRRDDHAY